MYVKINKKGLYFLTRNFLFHKLKYYLREMGFKRFPLSQNKTHQSTLSESLYNSLLVAGAIKNAN